MVDQAISLNIDQAIDSKPWTPEEFQQVLRIFTEQVSCLLEDFVKFMDEFADAKLREAGLHNISKCLRAKK